MRFPSSGVDVYAPVFTVKLKEQDEIIPRKDVAGMEVVEELENPGMFTILFNDMLDMKKQRYQWLDDARIQPGTLIEVSLSYASSSSKNTLIFLGRIKSVTHNFDSNGNVTLAVTGFDLSHDLQKSWKGKGVYTDMTYSQIIKEIAGANQLSFVKSEGEAKEANVTYENVSRWFNEYDYWFIKRLADNIGFEFFVREKSLYFRKPEDEKDSKLTFTNGVNIVNFVPKVSISTVVNEVKLNSWDRYKKEKISETATLEDIKNCVYVPDLMDQQCKNNILENINVSSAEEAKTRSMAELKKINKHLMTGRLGSIGNPSLRPGMTVKIEKVGDNFSGVYYVEKATHSVKEKGYSTIVEMRRCK